MSLVGSCTNIGGLFLGGLGCVLIASRLLQRLSLGFLSKGGVPTLIAPVNYLLETLFGFCSFLIQKVRGDIEKYVVHTGTAS